jgi:hypothetical protein
MRASLYVALYEYYTAVYLVMPGISYLARYYSINDTAEQGPAENVGHSVKKFQIFVATARILSCS